MINKNFTLLWLGKIVSQLGDKFYAIALAWWILQKTNSPSIMGFFLLVSVLPGILLGIIAGALTDRWQRKKILVFTDLIRGLLVLIIAYLSMCETLEIRQVFVIGFFLSLATAFFEPAMQAIIPDLVSKEQLTKANSLSQLVGGVCTIAGPLLGAIAVSIFGLTSVFSANSISYFISSLLAGFITIKQTHRDIEEKAGILEDVRKGIDFIKRQKRIMLVMKVIAVTHLFMGGLTVALPFLAQEIKGNGVNNLGYLEMMLGVGLVTGSALMGLPQKTSISERLLSRMTLVVGCCFLTMSTLQYFKVQTVMIYMVTMTVIGGCIALASISWQTLLQMDTPVDMTGRVFSISTLIGNTSLPLAYGIFGILLNISSIPVLMAGSGFCLLLFSFYLAFSIKNTPFYEV